jgi:hypothetical protein
VRGYGPGGVLAGAARRGRMPGLASLAPDLRVLATLVIVILLPL